MEKKLIVGNWKMNGDIDLAKDFGVSISGYDGFYKVIICPPYTLLYYMNSIFADSKIVIGAQDCHHQDRGAHTGSISAGMIRETGSSYVIIGHYERRKMESHEIIYNKVRLAIDNGLMPIVCVYQDKEMSIDEQREIFLEQIEPLKGLGVIFAYEPSWAIGSGTSLGINEIISAVNIFREITDCLILYGGSVSVNNAKNIISVCDGVLVGGASLKLVEFLEIIEYNDEK